MRVHLTCPTCGQAFERWPSNIKGERTYCSIPCRSAATVAQYKDDTSERFWPKVNRNGPVAERFPELGHCWIWTASLTTTGYGHFVANRRLSNASRVAWGLAGEPAREGHVLHVCDVRACVRNDTVGTYEVNGITYERRGHLFLGDNSVNVADKEAKGRGGHRGNVGTQNPAAKLTDEQVVEIRTLYTNGQAKRQALADAYHVHISLIDQIVWGLIWKHAGGPIRVRHLKA